MREHVNRRDVMKVAGTGALAGTAGCLGLIGGSSSEEVAIGGKQFTEQLILSNISKLLLDDAGFQTDAKFPIGGNTANHEALTNGRTDHYWEYTGTGWNYHLGNSEEKIRDPDELHQKVNEAYQEQYGIKWLDRAKFNNTYVVTANPAWQEETGIDTMTGLAEHINAGNEVTWAVSQEFINNPTAFGDMPGFYGYEDSMENVKYEKMAIGTINYKAVSNGQVDLGVGFATNPNIEKFDLGVVKDDNNWFVIYYPAPLVREELLTDEMADVLNKPSSELDTETMRSLNAKVSIDNEDPEDVAENWLQEQGML